MIDPVTLWQICATFFVIGALTFGGGNAMLSLIQTEVVVRHGWISEGTFTDIVAISQSTPGPIGINCATYVGYEVGGFAGSLAATLSLVLPSLILFFAVIRFYGRFHDSRRFSGVMSALRPAVAGLIAAAALILMFEISWDSMIPHLSVVKENFPDWKSWAIFGTAAAASLGAKANPILLILLGAVAGLIVY